MYLYMQYCLSWEARGMSVSEAIDLSSWFWYDVCVPVELSPRQSHTHKPQLLICFCKVIYACSSLELPWEHTRHDVFLNRGGWVEKKIVEVITWEIWKIQKESSTELSEGILHSTTWEKQEDMEKWKQGQKMSHALNTPLQWQHRQKHVCSLSVLFLPPFPFLFRFSVCWWCTSNPIYHECIAAPEVFPSCLQFIHIERVRDGIRPFIWLDRLLFQLELRQRGIFKVPQSPLYCSCTNERCLMCVILSHLTNVHFIRCCHTFEYLAFLRRTLK